MQKNLNNKPKFIPYKLEPHEMKIQKKLDKIYKNEAVWYRALIVSVLTFFGILIYMLHFK